MVVWTPGRISRKVKRRWRSAIPEITALQKVAMDFDRFEALLDGLLEKPDGENRPDFIEISIPGFEENIFTHPDDAPELSPPNTREDYLREREAEQ